MGLTIELCNDIEKYEENVVGGFNIRKTLTIFVAVLIGAGTMAFSYFVLHLPIIVSVYVMIPVLIPVVFKGFYGKKSSFIKMLKQMYTKKKPLVYRSTEKSNYVTEITTGGTQHENDENKKNI